MNQWIECTRICPSFSWADTRSPDTCAAINDNSPATTVDATNCAKTTEFISFYRSRYLFIHTPINSKHACCGANDVPPPIVPTSIAGIVTDMYKPASPLCSSSSIKSRQCDDSTTWAASWPVARKMAATIFEAWAFQPPSEPASDAPTRFFFFFYRTISATSHFNTEWRMVFGMWTSQETDFPRPNSQFTEEGFLSVHLE